MYGKVMSVPDAAMPLYAKLVTRWGPAEVAAFEKGLADGSVHPRDAKMKLAHEITATYYSEADADKGQAAFISLFQKGDIPDEMPEHALQENQTVLDVILGAKMATSRSEARRLIDQKGVKLDGEVLERGDVAFPHPGVLQVGKRKFLRVK
jgi:tyrosyl-tRNA synthetase